MALSDNSSRQLSFLHLGELTVLIVLLGLFLCTRLARAHHKHYKYIQQFGGTYDPFYACVFGTFIIKALRSVFKGGSFFSSLFYSVLTLANKHKSHFVIYAGFEANIVCYRADEIEAVMAQRENIAKPFIIYGMIVPWLKQGLLTSTGNKWRSRRKMLTPTFHAKILEIFAVIFNRHARVFCSTLAKRTDGKMADVVPFVENLTLGIVCETVMGVNLAMYDKTKTKSYLASVKRIGQLMLYRAALPYQWPEWLYKITPSGREMYRVIAQAYSFTETVIQERKQFFEDNPECLQQLLETSEDNAYQCKKPFLDILLKEHFRQPESFTIQDLREEVDTFMFGGHDTTAMALSFALFLLGHHDDVQHKIFDELLLVLGGDADRDLTFDEVRQLKYLDCVVKECLRVYPSVPIVGRCMTKDLELNGKTAPKGSNVYCLLYQLNRDPEYFPDPERFQPERFLLENAACRHPYAFLPFSAGPRNCIGQKFAMLEEKIVIAWIIRRFRLQSLIPRDEVQLYTEIVLRSVNGLPVQWIPR